MMAYSASNLGALTYVNGFTLWHYRTPDTAAEVASTGYFHAAGALLRVGDFIFITACLPEATENTLAAVIKTSGGVKIAYACRVEGDAYDD